MDGSLVSISIIDLLMSLLSDSSPRIFGILRVNNIFLFSNIFEKISYCRFFVFYVHCVLCE